jgi:predicted unusual protein kinase regulating ubiquinone biosynthesis (AarF/ABC1/UbiB family)
MFSNEVAYGIFKSEFGYEITDVFEDISKEPIAAASIGQVYKARLKSTGEEVALKI